MPYMRLVNMLKMVDIDELSPDDWMCLLYYCPYDLGAGVSYKEEMNVYKFTEHKLLNIVNNKRRKKREYVFD